jgi:hypothetical protein
MKRAFGWICGIIGFLILAFGGSIGAQMLPSACHEVLPNLVHWTPKCRAAMLARHHANH